MIRRIAKGRGNGADGRTIYNNSSPFSEKRKTADSLRGFKTDDQIGTVQRNHRRVHVVADADVTYNTAAALRHADCFGGADTLTFGHCGLREKLGCKDRTLSADSG